MHVNIVKFTQPIILLLLTFILSVLVKCSYDCLSSVSVFPRAFSQHQFIFSRWYNRGVAEFWGVEILAVSGIEISSLNRVSRVSHFQFSGLDEIETDRVSGELPADGLVKLAWKSGRGWFYQGMMCEWVLWEWLGGKCFSASFNRHTASKLRIDKKVPFDF